jgi:hypothetical protein
MTRVSPDPTTPSPSAARGSAPRRRRGFPEVEVLTPAWAAILLDALRSNCSGVGHRAIWPILPRPAVVALHPSPTLRRPSRVRARILGAPDRAGVGTFGDGLHGRWLAHIHNTLLQTETVLKVEPAGRLRRSCHTCQYFTPPGGSHASALTAILPRCAMLRCWNGKAFGLA